MELTPDYTLLKETSMRPVPSATETSSSVTISLSCFNVAMFAASFVWHINVVSAARQEKKIWRYQTTNIWSKVKPTQAAFSTLS